MLHKIPRFSLKERGVTATEYALIIAVVALIMLVGAKVLGVNIASIFTSVAGEI
jgi:pilus assembly protein Flp/PilA